MSNEFMSFLHSGSPMEKELHRSGRSRSSARVPSLRAFLTDQRGLNTVELVVIIAVVIGLALLFRTRINAFVTTLLDGMFSTGTAEELVRGMKNP